ncbi:ATP-grasp domain-containing protein [Phytohabitans aurantiacus]|uniref:ATP-grasp domain-containing protein n=1 Tax=Phytohabitans aurantiacus TaxID=3016789 RepID=A0ABQ5QTP0_9ACTN|nr:hypothetical protein [Phytohabitans aurantiacus]GLH97640.1 ATP-grasp domain-containing protein [Phytohabitans aurantiacus]
MTVNVDPAARERSRVALVTCAELPDLDPDDRLLIEPLRAFGIEATPVAWDATGVDWSSFRLAVLRSPWDYTARRDEFVAWAAGVPSLANPADIVQWNTDKRYLGDLTAAGVPVVPTAWATDDTWTPPAGEAYVVKPSVGAGSVDTGRYRLGDPDEARLAREHAARLIAAGRTVMIQPYLPAVDTYGETALLYLPDESGKLAFSHAIRKGAMLDGPDTGATGLYKEETIKPRVPIDAELAVGEQALAAIPGGPDRLLYARVDVIPDEAGRPLLVELELTEPSLFLATAEAAPARLARAIASHR